MAQPKDTANQGYDPLSYPPVAVTVDVVALTIRNGLLSVLLVERGQDPFKGYWALPGGFVRTGDLAEDIDSAAKRKLTEETGLVGEIGWDAGPVHLEQLATYGAVDRDPRMRVVSSAYLAFSPHLDEAHAGGDAIRARYVPVADLKLKTTKTGTAQSDKAQELLAFDHAQIIADGVERARAKLEYTPLATAFCGTEFTIPELRAVYEAVWGESLHASNFQRKVLSVPGFVEAIDRVAPPGRRGPRARLYRAGDAHLLHPALLRPGWEAQVR